MEMPEYGFGDPKSTSIMEHAATKLIKTGAVRHGSECFNYYFPQEIDEMFLLISDTLKPVPWKYVKVDELQSILATKIREGFVFPLNPKWILCDPGWKKIYDELMASDALYADLSKDVWYPHHTGIRDRIEEVYKKHPNGFQPCTDATIATSGMIAKLSTDDRRNSATNLLRDALGDGAGALTGNAVADLAQLELDDFTDRTRNSTIVGNTGQPFHAALSEVREAMNELDESAHASSQMSHASSAKRPPSSSMTNSTISDASRSRNSDHSKHIQFDESAKSSKAQRRPSGAPSVGSINSTYSTTSQPNSSNTARSSNSPKPKKIKKKFSKLFSSRRFFKFGTDHNVRSSRHDRSASDGSTALHSSSDHSRDSSNQSRSNSAGGMKRGPRK